MDPGTLSLLVFALVVAYLVGASVSLVALAILCRQAMKGRDRLLDERERVIEELQARLVDAWREVDEKEERISTLERGNERLQRLAVDATEGWKDAVVSERMRKN